jgi:hypothetical protein
VSIAVLSERVGYLKALDPAERRELLTKHERVAASTEDRCPLYLRLMSAWIVVGLDAIGEGRDPERTMNEAVAVCGEPAEEIERALAQLGFANEIEAERRRPAPVIGRVDPTTKGPYAGT